MRSARPGFDEGVIGAERLLQDAALAVDGALFLAARDLRADSDRRVECWNACAERAHAFAEDALRHEFELDFAGVKLLLEIFRARAGKSGHDAANLAVLEKDAQLAFAGATVVTDYFQPARALPGESLNQVVGKAGAAEPAEQDSSPVGNVADGVVHRGKYLIFVAHLPFGPAAREGAGIPRNRFGTRGGGRTHTSREGQGILSPPRMPFRHPGTTCVNLPYQKGCCNGASGGGDGFTGWQVTRVTLKRSACHSPGTPVYRIIAREGGGL